MPSIAEEISLHFLLRDYLWSFDGELRVPTAEEVQHTLDNMKAGLYTESEGSSMMVGRLIMHRTGHHRDVYVYLGDMGE